MKIPADQFEGSLYHLMIQTIVPRPIAWALSKNQNGSFNVAPFSYFNGVTGDPPVLMLSIGYKRDGERKDTWQNIEREKEFVVHVPSVEQAQNVTDSAYEFAAGESEQEALGMSLVRDAETSSLPRLQEVKVAFYCQYLATHLVGRTQQGLILAEIKEFYIDDSILSEEKGRLLVDAKAWSPLARLGGNDYASLGEIITVDRPKTKPVKA